MANGKDRNDLTKTRTSRNVIKMPVNLKQEFDSRHDFDDDDLETLSNKYPNTTFKQIPSAWILEIDKLLRKVYSENPTAISSIKQECGSLNISFRKNMGRKYSGLVEKTLSRLQSLDKDLHEQKEYETKVKAILQHKRYELES